MNDTYEYGAIERKWKDRWEREGTHMVDLDRARRPFYNLMMFPYPSAEGLHVGNVFAFVGADIQGRYRKALGYDVFEPMGFDAFGMHSENQAIRTGVHQRDMVGKNIRRFHEEQLNRIGNMFDWSHEVDTTDPRYYRWTQWIFLQLYKAGLAYRSDAEVTWCPSCKTVLADEQAEGGTCERCGARVERRSLAQWFSRITTYAVRLLEDLDRIDWSVITKETQRRWIGRSEGANVVFAVHGSTDRVTVSTTRPDTLWGATFLALSPDHPLAERVTADEQRAVVERCRAAVRQRSHAPHGEALGKPQGDATGPGIGAFTGAYAVHPATGARLPIWVAEYVSMGYGTGAVMGVPAHDARDRAFARALQPAHSRRRSSP